LEIYLAEIAPGLYKFEPTAAAQDTYAYYLLLSLASPHTPPSPGLNETWIDPNLVGLYIFLPEDLQPGQEAEDFAEQARHNLPSVFYTQTQPNVRFIVWLAGRDQCANPVNYVLCGNYQPPPNSTRFPIAAQNFSWSGFELSISTYTIINLDVDDGALQFNTSQWGTNAILLYFYGQLQTVTYYTETGWTINIPLLGKDTGTLCFQIGLDWGTLCQLFGCCLSYFYPADDGYLNLSYPLFPSTDPNFTNQNQFLGFDIRLHPLYPTDSAHSRLSLDLTGDTIYSLNSQQMVSNYFQTVSGEILTLIPHNPDASPPDAPVTSPGSPEEAKPLLPGFAFCKAPAASSPLTSPPDYDYYLAPVGLFRLAAVTPPQTSSAQGTTTSGTDIHWMCGLFAQEFLHVQIGDLIEFESNNAAWASGFTGTASTQQTGSSTAQTLEADFTTSWVRYPVENVEGARAYFAQPSSSVYYANADETQVYPTAVFSKLSDFPRRISFPLALYGGIYQSSTPNGVIVYNKGIPPAVFAALEAAVLSSVRHSALSTNLHGPVFLQSSALTRRQRSLLLMEAPETSLAAMPYATTPQGLLVKLNTTAPQNGTWKTVYLARSPDDPTTYLSIEPPSGSTVINAELSNVLMQNQLFLVVSNPDNLGQFNSLLRMCRFNFLLDVSLADTILIFKYNTSLTLKELIAQPSLWAESAAFVGGSPSQIEDTQQAILDYIQTAEDDANASGNPFGYFNELANRKEWTGILAMHCAIDGRGMPPDLEMLLGGINGQLRAHHFGIEANRVVNDEGELTLQDSSLFGVIYYRNENPPDIDPAVDFAYAVETLTVVFQNSNITQFATKIGLTINTLFGRAVELISESGLSSPMLPNTLIITGQYQTQDGVGTLTFVTDSPITYKFVVEEERTRVLDQIEFTKVALIPLSAGDAMASPQEIVLANFNLSGQLWFNPNPFAGSDNLDLFSYGTAGSPGTGMAFNSLVINMQFALDEKGAMVPGSETLTLQPDLLTFTPDSQAIREGSLLNSLPLQLSKFTYAPAGLSTTQLGAKPVHVLQLESANTLNASPPPQTGNYPYLTSTPQFILEYDLPLGSLGSLSDLHAGLMAKLLLAWGPSQVIPDNDGAAVLVQLPQAMAGYGGFNLEGILQTTFGDANLLKVDLESGPVYAVLFNNIKLSVFGFSFPPGVLIDFVVFAGQPEQNQSTNSTNIAWFLAATQPVGSPPAQ
jgi:hypothetical protein